MSWLSSAWDSVKSVGSKIGGVVKKIATPVLSFAAGLVPGVGPLLSKGVDVLGNTLVGDTEDTTSPAVQNALSPTQQYMAATTGQAVGLGSSTAAQALASATVQAEDESRGVFGIGDGKPGVFGIGDGKPGLFGIGTGKSKARKQAEDAARGEGLSPKAVKLAGDEAAAAVEHKMSKVSVKSEKSGGSGDAALAIPLVGGLLALLFAL